MIRLAPGSPAWLAALCAARLLAATWFVAWSAVLAPVQAEWSLTGREAGLVQAAFHAGYLLSLFVVGFLADRGGAKRAWLTTGIAAWVTPFLFVAFAEGFASACALHFLTGLAQGGSYTPLLALVAEHVPRERRARAMGWVIAASSAGYALALAVAAVALAAAGWRTTLAAIALMPLVAWLVALAALAHTPNTVHAQPAGASPLASLRALVRNRRGVLSILGYSFHNWELLGLWAWLPAFLTAALAAGGARAAEAAAAAVALSALSYLANVAGSVTGGAMADRIGRTRAILVWSVASLAISFSIGWLVAAPLALVIVLACAHNFTAIADSATHSTVLAESVPPHMLGVAYAVRSVLGFGAGVASPVVFGWTLDAVGGGPQTTDPVAWGLAWATLGAGAFCGPIATWRLHRAMRP